MAGDDVFAVHRSLAAEAAADIRGDQMDSMLGKSEHIGDLGARAMRSLGGEPDSQAVGEGVGTSDDATRLHRQCDLAWTCDVHGENMIRGGECSIDIAAIF